MNEIISKFIGDYRFLSNFWPVEIEKEQIIYPSVEHAYQAAKVINVEIRKKIADLKNPADAKKLGNKIELRTDWESVKVSYMYEFILKKFAHSPLTEQLLNTYDTYLMEGNYWHDNFWGVCLCTTCYKNKWGKNMLGRLLMQTRNLLGIKE